MCGIFGAASAGARRFDEPFIRRASTTLAHRGPDDEGVWLSPDRAVGFGHRRLSIIDLSNGGHQPMESASGDLVVVYNGELYNYRELREELRATGSKFSTASDTEVLLEAYQRWGEDCLARFNGMFAFALFDRRTRRLFAARDRAGEKPFFYRHSGGAMLFASELKALMADDTVPRVIDRDALDAYLTYGYVPAEQCILQGFRKLPAAHALTYDLGSDRLTTWRYWDLPMASDRPTASADEALEACTQLLDEAVRMRLVADVPVGVLLSGGVDSSLVTAFAARRVSSLKTFTVSFPGHARFDEAPFARQVADHFATDHTELPAEQAGVELLPVLARQYDEPIGDHSIIPSFLVSRLIRQHATVALGGDGGDELFGGYPHYSLVMRIAQLSALTPGPLRHLVAAAARRLPLGTRGRNHLSGIGGGAGSELTQVNVYFDGAARRRLLAPAAWRGVASEGPERRRASLSVPTLSVLQNATRMDFLTTLPDDYLVKVDRASMLSSLEIRAPFLDHRLVEYAFSELPDELRVNRTERKILLRRLAARLLPPALDLRRKQGFTVPLAAWFRGPWGSFVRDVLLDDGSQLFAHGAVMEILRLQARGYANSNRIFALLMFELWRREYGAVLPPQEGQ